MAYTTISTIRSTMIRSTGTGAGDMAAHGDLGLAGMVRCGDMQALGVIGVQAGDQYMGQYG